ncbi:YdbL family protein [Parasphingopyxis marina]|uniref:YdbL family protein n=1 Tax=Parasphingopyxis marina TaxID=2761622 RepID=A0A842I0L4_9SPHN|nr:YdbL family protein [Parasphingopyxis marina]MBC2778223.1 YdbL family protein [Parasphingopyxis marina]
MTKRNTIIAILAAATALAGGVATMAPAQNAQISQAIAAGIVGETASGYLGFAQTPSAELRAQVDALNLSRRSAYANLAQQRGVTRQQVAAETFCAQIPRIDPGEAYQLSDGVWRVRGAAPIPTPANC